MDQLWPADQVERWPLSRLIPYARNARQHSDEQVAQIAASIKEWGWTVPVLADEGGGLICGHGRVLAARQLGLDEVPHSPDLRANRPSMQNSFASDRAGKKGAGASRSAWRLGPVEPHPHKRIFG